MEYTSFTHASRAHSRAKLLVISDIHQYIYIVHAHLEYVLAGPRVWVHICTRVGAFCDLYCPISLLHARVSQVFLNTCMRVCGGIGSGVLFQLVHGYRLILAWEAMFWRG